MGSNLACALHGTWRGHPRLPNLAECSPHTPLQHAGSPSPYVTCMAPACENRASVATWLNMKRLTGTATACRGG